MYKGKINAFAVLGTKFFQVAGIIVPTARQSVSQGRNGNVDRLYLSREGFSFRDRREEGQVV